MDFEQSSATGAQPVLDLAGREVDGLTFLARVADGPLGQVWRGHDQMLDIPVAIKVLAPQLAENQAFVRQFMLEARAVARLNHHNIQRVLQAGMRELDGHVLRLMVMEDIKGESLEELLSNSDRGRFESEAAAEIALAIARALRYAHQRGVVHCDLRPANILIANERHGVKVFDFGLARILSRSFYEAPEQQVVALPLREHGADYLAPEVLAGRDVDGRADVYSLGKTLRALLTGTPDGEPARAKPSPMATSLFAICEALCQQEPAKRKPMVEVIEEIERILGSAPPTVKTTRLPSYMPSTNLRPPSTSFLGRARELRALAVEINVEAARLVTIIGAAGVGKTRLSQEFGLANGDVFSGGIWFCDAAAASTENDLCRAVAVALGLQLAPGNPAEQIHAALSYRRERVLLIIDNFEQLVEVATGLMTRWLEDTPQVSFLVTSREALQVDGEVRFPLHPLATESVEDEESNPYHSKHGAAVQLFLDRAQRENPVFSFNDDALTAIKKLVETLDGIPLAIELAAARSRVLPPQKMLERMAQRLDLLNSRTNDGSSRQRTLRSAIGWSWDLLKPWEQLALAQASVFRNGFFLEAAEEVLDLSSCPDAHFEIDAIEALVDKSLLRAEEFAPLRDELRYRLFESVREFAHEKLHEMDREGKTSIADLQRRHARYYAEYGEKWSSQHSAPRDVEASQRLSIESENAIVAIKESAALVPTLSARVMLVFRNAIFSQSSGNEMVDWTHRILKREQEIAPLLAVRLYATIVSLAVQGREPNAGFEAASKALEFAQSMEGRFDAVTCSEARYIAHEALAISQMLRGNYAEAYAAVCKAEEEYRLVENSPVDFCRILRTRGVISLPLGKTVESLEYFDAALKLARKIGSRAEVLATVSRSVSVFTNNGDFESAEACCAEIEALSTALGSTAGFADSSFNRGIILYGKQEYRKAIAAYEEAERIYRQNGQERNGLICLGNRATVYANIGENERSLECHLEALAIWRSRGDRMMMTSRLLGISGALTNLKRYERAIEVLEEAEELARATGVMPHLAAIRSYQASTLIYSDKSLRDQGKLERACAAATESHELYLKMKSERTRLGFDATAALAYGHFGLSQLLADGSPADAQEHADLARRYALEAEDYGSTAPVARVEEVGEGKEVPVRAWLWTEQVLNTLGREPSAQD